MNASWPQTGSWALAVCMALTLFVLWLLRRWKRQDEAREALLSAQKDLLSAQEEYREKVRTGTPEEAHQAANRVKALWAEVDRLEKLAGVFCLFLCVLASGCVRSPGVIWLDEHVRIVEPGSVVPPYPDGETRWWLLSPTGFDELVPIQRQKGEP